MQSNLEEASWAGPGAQSGDAAPVRVDIEDRSEAFVLTADLPGFGREDVELRVDDRTLRIDADRTPAETDGEFVRRERSRGSVGRSVTLPDAVAVDGIDATLADGVLTVRLPKRDPDDGGTRIEVN